MSGVRIGNGIRRIAAKSGTKASTMATPMTLPVYMLAMRPHTNSGFSRKSIGPGWRPQMMRPPSITAAVGLPGIPRVIIGSSDAPPAAWAAVSGRPPLRSRPGRSAPDCARSAGRTHSS